MACLVSVHLFVGGEENTSGSKLLGNASPLTGGIDSLNKHFYIPAQTVKCSLSTWHADGKGICTMPVLTVHEEAHPCNSNIYF